MKKPKQEEIEQEQPEQLDTYGTLAPIHEDLQEELNLLGVELDQ